MAEFVEGKATAFMDEMEHYSSVKINDEDFDNVKDGLVRLIQAGQADILEKAISEIEHIKIDGRDGDFDKGVDEALSELRGLLAEIKKGNAGE